MRQRRLAIVLVLALGCGGLAAYLALGYLRDRSVVPALRSDPGVAKVAVAARDLPPGTVLGDNDVVLVSWPGSTVPVGFARSKAEVVGRGLIVPVAANEPLLERKLASPDGGGGLPIAIPQGMRALSVKVDEVIGVAGFVVPGTRVDVIVTLNPREQNQQPMSRVVLQNILTLASGKIVEQTPENEPKEASVITLLVDPQQAELLVLAANEGRIQLALRNSMDLADALTPGVRLVNLLGQPVYAPSRGGGGPRRASARPADRAPIVVELYQAGSRSTLKF